ncbi:predicted protein [Nematostella vectensis]|uniref:Aspartate dehydrogenase domain-containing protein n=1 Tax=Nematostella vectensis TaxID=45351 RepID=A7S563_NEMVE|nr:predicted protein [Nematostella vectensis]|eukprot:XP_001633251.1 predicted protein [Nematostella vectensis]
MRIGIVGFGHLGKYLYEAISTRDDLEVAFVWNRSKESMEGKIEEQLILTDLSLCAERKADLIVEVAHPAVIKQYGLALLNAADLMIGSPTVLANSDVEERLRAKAEKGPHAVYVPSGALWGGENIKKMADRGTLKGLKITMRKHPSCFKLADPLESKAKEKYQQNPDMPTILYDGPVRGLCPLAPNNVNTMAAAATAAHNLGFDVVQGCLVADTSLNAHIVEVDVTGLNGFTVKTVRTNPSAPGAVTGNATFASFLSSILSMYYEITQLCFFF